MSNYEKQKRWRERNRALYNMQQRDRRKKARRKKVGKVEVEKVVEGLGSKESKLAQLREMMKGCEKAPAEARPTIYKDDYGRVITEGQWRRLLLMKEKAFKGGYDLDEWSQ